MATAAAQQPRSTFAGNVNPFTGQRVNKAAERKTDRKQVDFVDPDKLQISDDPLPSIRQASEHKYKALFERLKPGKCIVCEGAQAGKIGHALSTYLKKKGDDARFKVRTTKYYEKDGKGRVWLLKAE